MTTFEHAMVGINGAIAAGLPRSYGWKIVALAGVAAIAPDWDGLPMLIDMQAFERGHRVWGHSILSCVVLGLLMGVIDYRWDLIGRLAYRFRDWGPLAEVRPLLTVRRKDVVTELADEVKNRQSPKPQTNGLTKISLWCCVAVVGCLSQIPCDIVVSGGEGLSDWAVKPFWPFSDRGVVYPMIRWGDVGPTVIFGLGMIALAKFKAAAQGIAIATLVAVIAYLLIRHWFV